MVAFINKAIILAKHISIRIYKRKKEYSMKKEPIKFSDYKLVIPNMRKFIKKMEQFVNELKACNNAEEASKIIKKLNIWSNSFFVFKSSFCSTELT